MFNQKIKKDTLVASYQNRMIDLLDNANGKIGIPILLYFLGVPGIVVLVLWVLFFRD